MSEIFDADVVVVGYGPVGMTTAALLGRAGHSVIALERYPSLFNLPRAGIFDDEIMRTLAKLDIAPALIRKIRAQEGYEWRNGDGELLIEHSFALRGRSGWAEWYQFYQPDLEQALDKAVRDSGNVEVRFNTTVTGYDQDDEGVSVSLADGTSVRARYVVAADGGNGFSRGALNAEYHDYGFSEPWMPCDFEITADVDLPHALQICDPKQPRSVISLGPKHQRFAFLLKSEEDFEQERSHEKVWARVSSYINPEQAKLVRVATYVFRSLVVDKWRHGKIMLAGDAAHQMPPFLGQGMCSGVRDAQSLAFRLDLILTGRAGDGILDGYQTEREPQVTAVLLKGIELGRIQTTRDLAVAQERDRRLLADRAAKRKPEKMRFPGIGPGLIADQEAAGSLFPQGDVFINGHKDRFDTVLGFGLTILSGPEAPRLSSEAKARARQTADIVAELTPEADAQGIYTDWFREHNAQFVIVRPDFYVYGTATDETGLLALIEQFEQ
ncbi:bifunctional 3-(3-hydroxy-phenyl)propionate/3-hydroxycinnamic acid hydroxylase, partial [Arthrobacter sp. NPDC056727]|uniref:bifunctional 3-(3-hydroxy-phenyl)propionate/3-hydroxycinnamic acid hydroxylase n=1 Tax=Arthrobacter sp. NPDC056727 TaxID=3345927 RepID=UPI0036715F14